MQSQEKKTRIPLEVGNGLDKYGSFENNMVVDTYL